MHAKDMAVVCSPADGCHADFARLLEQVRVEHADGCVRRESGEWWSISDDIMEANPARLQGRRRRRPPYDKSTRSVRRKLVGLEE
jgi:hypothetical protein